MRGNGHLVEKDPTHRLILPDKINREQIHHVQNIFVIMNTKEMIILLLDVSHA